MVAPGADEAWRKMADEQGWYEPAGWHVPAARRVVLEGEPLPIGTCQGHGIFQRRRVLELDVGLQWISETRSENVDLVLLHEVIAARQQRQELGLVVGNRAVPV
jgi:hypothetical protein